MIIEEPEEEGEGDEIYCSALELALVLRKKMKNKSDRAKKLEKKFCKGESKADLVLKRDAKQRELDILKSKRREYERKTDVQWQHYQELLKKLEKEVKELDEKINDDV
jgi:CHAD domain-containing protein